MPLEIFVNGERAEVSAGATVLDLLARLGRDPRTVAVEHNGEILPRGEYAAAPLRAGDRLEIVHFVQGGRPARGEFPETAAG
ncbi:MAG TPA: sulfur carrier protein ThiS [Thermoanaerobaculia bacterium]|nr:sulfur carrier protein ThiS [Thermoanaerobaculia bacterium]